MKKTIMLSLCCLTALTASANGGGPDETTLNIISIIFIVFGVLQIILFFKIWGMTNDVKAMKKDMFNENAFSSMDDMAQYIRKNIVLGNTENVKRILLQNFMDNVENEYKIFLEGITEKDEKGESHTIQYTSEQIMSMSLIDKVEHLQKQFNKIGEELPSYVRHMTTFGDFFNIFLKDDLEITKQQEQKNE